MYFDCTHYCAHHNVNITTAAGKSDVHVAAATTALSSLTLEEPGSDEEEEGTQTPQELPEYACRCVILSVCLQVCDTVCMHAGVWYCLYASGCAVLSACLQVCGTVSTCMPVGISDVPYLLY